MPPDAWGRIALGTMKTTSGPADPFPCGVMLDDFDEVLAAARGGDESAFTSLFRSVQPLLLRYLRTVARDGAVTADDVAADTWMSVVRGLGRFRGDEDGFRGWVFTIARARLVDARRSARRLPLPVDAAVELTERPGAADVPAAVDELMTTEAALELVGRLAPDQAEAVVLRHVVGLDVAQTARVLGKKPGAVRIATMRGLHRLRELLPGAGPAAGWAGGVTRTMATSGDSGDMTTRRHRLSDDPKPDPRVAVLLAAAAAPTEPGPQPGEDAALAAFRAAAPAPTRRIRMLPTLKATAIAATATGALMVGGVAAAATGALPGAASDTARAALARVGVTVAGPAAASGTHSATHGSAKPSSGTTGSTDATVPSPGATANAHGKAVSELATTTTLTGRDKGVAISTLASGGKARHGQHPTSTATETASVTGQATATAHRHKPTTAPTHSPGTD